MIHYTCGAALELRRADVDIAPTAASTSRDPPRPTSIKLEVHIARGFLRCVLPAPHAYAFNLSARVPANNRELSY